MNPVPHRFSEMRVLHVIPAFYPALYFGGPVTSVYALCNHLARRSGVKLRVLTTDTSGPGLFDRLDEQQRNTDQYVAYDVQFHRKFAGTAIAPGIVPAIYRAVSWADIVHLTGVYSFPTFPTLTAARALRKPLMWSPRGSLQLWTGTRRRRLKRIWEFLCSMAVDKRRTLLHMTSADEVMKSARASLGVPSTVVPNGVDIPARIPARTWLPGGVLRVVYLGRLDPIKGIENLLESLSLLKDCNMSLRLYGEGEAAYEAALRRLAVEPHRRVEFCGAVHGVAKVNALLNADLCVVPSHSENFGIVVAEALAHGIPVVASTGTPWRELESRRAGRWVPNDPRSLAEAIRSMQREDLQEMGRRGREWMQAEYHWTAIAAKMAAEYERLLVMAREPHGHS